jgi:ketosteroid isomerase-like protein
MKISVLLTVSVCVLSSQAIHRPGAPDVDPKAEVLNADADYRNAVLHGDTAKLARIFADDIIIVHSDGGRDTKANFLDAISSGRLKLTSYERKDVDVRIYGPVALMFSKTAKTFAYRGSPAKASRHIHRYLFKIREPVENSGDAEHAPKRVSFGSLGAEKRHYWKLRAMPRFGGLVAEAADITS